VQGDDVDAARCEFEPKGVGQRPFGSLGRAVGAEAGLAGRSDTGAGMIKNDSAIGSPMQISTTVLFLSTAESSFINGEMITADGGLSMNGDVHMQ